MYKVQPIVNIGDRISLPTCMYLVKNIHEDVSDISATDKTAPINPEITLQKPFKDIAMLQARQEKLLQQLESLRSQMLSMKKKLQTSPIPTKIRMNETNKLVKGDLPLDVVINVNPNYPPYSLLRLQGLLKLNVSCYTHSSVTTLPLATRLFCEEISKNNSTKPEANITLIWKEVDCHAEFITSSTIPLVICGEVNILRYFLSALPSQLTYTHQESSWEIDSILDLCHKLQGFKTVKERQSILRLLNTKLGKQNWFRNENISIVDLAAWSIIKQGNFQNDLTVSLKNWMQRCEQSSFSNV